MMGAFCLLVLLLLQLQYVAARTASTLIRELRQQIKSPDDGVALDVNPELLYPTHTLSVPVDHFHNETKYEPHSNGTFELRYWFDASHYVEGGPVILLEGGETSGTDRLVYLQKGILAQLAQATNGIGVVIEHRYYGESFPVSTLSTEDLRFLTTDQALADTAYFMQNVVFEGLEDKNLTAPTVPYIMYGGSYAGAFVAFMRIAYPDLVFGAISSSGVTEAIYDYWQYYEGVRLHGPQDCVKVQQQVTHIVDSILIDQANNTELGETLKDAFGLGNLTFNDDFANLLSFGISDWQNTNWDPEVNDPSFSEFCGNITSSTLLFPGTASLNDTAKKLVDAGGYSNISAALTTNLLNFIGYINKTEVAPCAASGSTQDSCFSNHDSSFYKQDDITQTWRSWPYQYCTEWGFLQTGSGVPEDIMPLVSRLVNLPYTSIICRDAFNITKPSDTATVNRFGGFNVSVPRLAIIDGQADPWRDATPHATDAPPRNSTIDQPFILMANAVHHWDENGLFPNETTADLPPAPIRDTQMAEHAFVTAWLKGVYEFLDCPDNLIAANYYGGAEFK